MSFEIENYSNFKAKLSNCMFSFKAIKSIISNETILDKDELVSYFFSGFNRNKERIRYSSIVKLNNSNKSYLLNLLSPSTILIIDYIDYKAIENINIGKNMNIVYNQDLRIDERRNDTGIYEVVINYNRKSIKVYLNNKFDFLDFIKNICTAIRYNRQLKN